MKKFFVLAACVVTSLSAFAFQAGMNRSQINNEVAQRVRAGESGVSIVAAAKASGVSAANLQAALVAAGIESKFIFQTMVTAGYSPDDLLSPTAAGRGEGRGGDGDGRDGREGRRFGESRSGNMSGTGGCRSVSCS